jgi:hypothetical protein
MKNKYFAAKPSKETVAVLQKKAVNWFDRITTNRYLDKIRNSWMAYYGITSVSDDGHEITFSGEQGELANISVNHYRNLGQHLHVMITASRPSLEARSVNNDYRSLSQTILANSLLDYYMREKRLEDILRKAAEYAIVFGSGYVKMGWNETVGDIYDYNDDTSTAIREGDVEFSLLSPLDVVFDTTKENTSDHDWVLCRSFKNKFDLAAKYPELEDEIVAIPSKSDVNKFRFDISSSEETDDIPVYEFYHKKTESMPEGRYLVYLTEEVTLLDFPMPYRALPVYRISPSDMLGTSYGYTPLFDLLPIQEAINSIYSTILSNHNAFGVQNIAMPEGCSLTASEIAGGLNIFSYNSAHGKPEPINFLATSPESYRLLDFFVRDMETMSGINSVARGTPQPSLESGSALALIQSMAIQFVSGLQQSYVRLMEDVGTGLINILKDFAKSPRIAAIAGVTNVTEMREFTGDDLASINRIICDVSNPLARCLAKDTPVLMYDGTFKMVQDIKINDLVMGIDSKPKTVYAANSGTEMMYRVTSKDKHQKVSYECNESHILSLKYCYSKPSDKFEKGEMVDITVRDYMNLSNHHKNLLQGFRTGVEFSKKDLTIPPYILGMWLGDGSSHSTALTSADQELVDAWSDYASSIGMKIRVTENRQPNRSKNYYITSGKASGRADRNPFMNELNSMEVIRNKHIPFIYLTSSREDRLQLLAGLIDTDGYRNCETFLFTQKNKRLVDDVVYLSRSLGFRTTVKKHKSASSKLVGEITGDCYRVTIGGNTDEIPVKLERKKCQKKEKARDWLNYGIQVEPIGQGTYYGFTLLEDPHFILGDFTVTHNTTAGRVQMADTLMQYAGDKFSIEQYFQVVQTGRLDAMTDGVSKQALLVTDENERLIAGDRKVVALVTDNHDLHIKKHADVLADTAMRHDPELLARTLQHIQEHLEMKKTTDPVLLGIVGVVAPQPPQPDQLPNPQPSAPDIQEAAMPNMPNLPAPFNEGQ